MDVFETYIQDIQDEEQRKRMREVLTWVAETFPQLSAKVAWKQPMFTDHETFIIGFSMSKQHISVAPEHKTIEVFSSHIKEAGYVLTSQLFRIKWKDTINYDLLHEIIMFNIHDKGDCTTFWRK